MYRFTILFVAVVVLISATAQTDAQPAPRQRKVEAANKSNRANDEWSVVEVARSGNVVARVRVLKKASLDKDDWMALEFKNQGTSPVDLSAQYVITADCSTSTGKGPLITSRSHPDFLLDARPTGNTDKRAKVAPSGNRMFGNGMHTEVTLPSGVFSVSTKPSSGFGAGLKMPPSEGWRVRAKFKLTMRVNNPNGPVNPAEQTFAFEWLHPDKAGIEKLRARLRELFHKPADMFSFDSRLEGLLNCPEVTRGIDVKEVLAALDLRGPQNFGDLSALVTFLNRTFAGSAEVGAYFKRRLEANDPNVVEILMAGHSDKIRSPEIVELLVKRAERSPHDCEWVIIVLYPGRGKRADPAVAQRLSAAWLKASPLLAKKPADIANIEDRTAWAEQMKMLGKTGDVNLIPRILPGLDDKTMVRSGSQETWIAPKERLDRVCDVALAAILTIEAWNEHDVSSEFGAGELLDTVPAGEAEIAAMENLGNAREKWQAGDEAPLRAITQGYAAAQPLLEKKRDSLIAALKKRLAAGH